MRNSIFNLIVISILLIAHAHAASEKSCNDILSNQIETTVRDLAQLRFDLDLQLSQGKESIITRALQTAFERKQSEALEAFSNNGMTSDNLKSRIEDEIQKIQGQHVEESRLTGALKQAQAGRAEYVLTEVTTLGNLSVPVSQAASAFLPKGKILVVGGREDGRADGTVNLQWIDPITQKIKRARDLIEPRLNAKVWSLADGSVLVAGGGSRGIELISADLKTVSCVGTATEKVLNASHEGFLQDGTLLIVGEVPYEKKRDFQNYVFYQFDPISKKLSELGRIEKLENEKTISIFRDGTVIMSGGYTVDQHPTRYDTQFLSSAIEKVNVFAMQSASQKWYSGLIPKTLKSGVKRVGDLIEPRYRHRQVVLKDGSILIVGGNTSHSPLSEVGIFDPKLNQYRPIGNLSMARTGGYALTLLADGRVLVTGGIIGIEMTGKVEIIDPERNTIEDLTVLVEARGDPVVTVTSENEVVVIGGVKNQIARRRLGENIALIEKIKIGRR